MPMKRTILKRIKSYFRKGFRVRSHTKRVFVKINGEMIPRDNPYARKHRPLFFPDKPGKFISIPKEKKSGRPDDYYEGLEREEFDEDYYRRQDERLMGISNSTIKEKNGFVLLRHSESGSPASESPDTWEIRDPSGKVVWESGIVYNNPYEGPSVGYDTAMEEFERLTKKGRKHSHMYQHSVLDERDQKDLDNFVNVINKLKANKQLTPFFSDNPRYNFDELINAASNHAFDDNPAKFGLTQVEANKFRSFMQHDARKDKFKKEINKLFPELDEEQHEHSHMVKIKMKRYENLTPKEMEEVNRQVKRKPEFILPDRVAYKKPEIERREALIEKWDREIGKNLPEEVRHRIRMNFLYGKKGGK